MTKKIIRHHESMLALYKKGLAQEGQTPFLIRYFNAKAVKLEAQIEQAKEEKLTCFDEQKYKLKGNQKIYGWYE